jgi:hypothetical protein
MKTQAKELIQEAITSWKSKKQFTIEEKQVHSYNSPIVDGEYVLIFTNSLNSFICNGKPFEISHTSRPFHTGTLSEQPISENPKGDKHRLEKFLEELDIEFFIKVENKLNECLETLSKSADSLFY